MAQAIACKHGEACWISFLTVVFAMIYPVHPVVISLEIFSALELGAIHGYNGASVLPAGMRVFMYDSSIKLIS